MTVIVQRGGVFYADSRTVARGVSQHENIVKITPYPSYKLENKLAVWDKEVILAVAGAGASEAITIATDILMKGGKEALDSYKILRNTKAAIGLDCVMLVLTANHCYEVNFRRSTEGPPFIVKNHKRDELVCIGSGRAPVEVITRFFKTDEIGTVCAALALSDTCGGYLRIYDTNAREPKMVTKLYRRPMLRVFYGCLLSYAARIGTWYNNTFKY